MTLQYNPEDMSWRSQPQTERDAIRSIEHGERPIWEREYLDDIPRM